MIEIKDTSIHIIRSFTCGFKYVEGIRRIKTSNIFPNGRKRRNSFNLEKVCCDANRSIRITYWVVNIQNSVFHYVITGVKYTWLL